MRAKFETECGDFEISLALDAAPLTAGYFQDLISIGAFNGASFFRIVSQKNASLRSDNPIEVIQGGLKDTDRQPIAAIAHETTSQTGLVHKKWTLSTARFGPGETYGSFFVCMRDEPALDFGGKRHPDGLGFAAFGSVVSGFEVLDAIFSRQEPDEFMKNAVGIKSATIVGG